MQWIFNVPRLVTGALVTLGFVTFGLVGMWCTHRWVLPRLRVSAHDSEFSGAILHGMLVIYGLAAALIAVAVWESYADVSKIVSNEATAMAMLYRDFGAYPEPVRGRLRDGLRAYTDYTIHEAWAQQRRGQVPTRGIAMVDRVQDELFSFQPTTEAEKILHAEALHAYNHLIEARRLRLDAVTAGLPGTMWAVVLLGGLVCLGATFVFRVESLRLHYTMVGLLAYLMGLVVFLILIYDRPFIGSHGIGPEAYELIFDQLMKP